MADPCPERERIDTLASDVAELKTGQAVTCERLSAMSARQDEHHDAQIAALGVVRTDNVKLSTELLNEVRANRPSDPLKNPKVLGLCALLIVALASPQLLPPMLSWCVGVPVADVVVSLETAETPNVVEPETDSEATDATDIGTGIEAGDVED